MNVNYLDPLFKQNSSGLRKLINEAWENDVRAWVRMHQIVDFVTLLLLFFFNKLEMIVVMSDYNDVMTSLSQNFG